MIPLAIFFMSLMRVSSRVFQQKNVIHDNYALMIPTSYMMSFLDIAQTTMCAILIIDEGFIQLIPLSIAAGTGGWLGCWLALWLHKRVKKC